MTGCVDVYVYMYVCATKHACAKMHPQRHDILSILKKYYVLDLKRHLNLFLNEDT